MVMTEPRQWVAYAERRTDLPDGREFFNIHAHPRTVEAYGVRSPVPILLTEEPNGDYWGWIDADRTGQPFAPKYTGDVIFVQPTRGLFTMQFPYGPGKEAERGGGEVVRLHVEAVPDQCEQTGGDHAWRAFGQDEAGGTFHRCRCGTAIRVYEDTR